MACRGADATAKLEQHKAAALHALHAVQAVQHQGAKQQACPCLAGRPAWAAARSTAMHCEHVCCCSLHVLHAWVPMPSDAIGREVTGEPEIYETVLCRLRPAGWWPTWLLRWGPALHLPRAPCVPGRLACHSSWPPMRSSRPYCHAAPWLRYAALTCIAAEVQCS